MPRSLRIATVLLAMGLGASTVAFRDGRAPSAAEAATVALAPPEPELKTAPSTPIAEQKALLGDDETWRPQWDAMIEKELPEDLLSPQMQRKVSEFCPCFNKMSIADSRVFWAYFFQALSGAEAGLDRTSDVRHTEPQVAVEESVSHRMVRSEGLLQLTYEDSDRYGCNFDWNYDKHLPERDPSKTILEPRNNLLCGVNILENQLVTQKKPLLSMSSYWSTLRPGWPGNKVFLQQMRNVPPECRGHLKKLMQTSLETAQLRASR